MPTPETTEEVPGRSALIREVWIAAAGILVVFALLKHLGPMIPIVGEHVFTIALAIQLYAPLAMRGRRGITTESLGLRLDRLRLDALWVGVLILLTTVPFAVGHHWWMTELYGRTFELRAPDRVFERIATQVVVGIGEETFYRGYLQERLQRIWPAKRQLFGAPFGLAIVVTAAVFALAHFVGEYRLDRLGPFFPALLFGLLRARTGSIVGAISYHAYCNLLGDFLWVCYRP